MSHKGKSRVHGIVTLCVFVHRARHGSYDRQLVRHFADLGKHRADRHATVTIPFEFERTGHHIAVVIELRSLDLYRHGLAVELLQAAVLGRRNPPATRRRTYNRRLRALRRSVMVKPAIPIRAPLDAHPGLSRDINAESDSMPNPVETRSSMLRRLSMGLRLGFHSEAWIHISSCL